jgi:hypothetical protein
MTLTDVGQLELGDQPASLVTDYWSVLVRNWIAALEPHLKELLALKRPSRPPSPREQSHAMAAVVLGAFALESSAARLRAVKKWVPTITTSGPKDTVLAFLGELPGFPTALLTDIGEVLVLRNALAHNHIWLMRQTLVDDLASTASVEVLVGRADFLTKRHATPDRRQTKRHRLNVVPDFVGYNDARKVLKVVIATLDTLASLDVPNMPSPARVMAYRLRSHRDLGSFSRMPRRAVRRV